MTIQELNSKYYALFNTLHNAAAYLPEKQYKAMSDVLMREYEQDVEDYLDEQAIAFGMQRFEQKFRVGVYLPRRRFLFWWNPVAKKLLKKYKAEFLTYLAALDKDVREEKQFAKVLAGDAAANSQQQTTALTVLSATDVAQQ